MTVQDHNDLYNELRKVIYTRGNNLLGLTNAQMVFVKAFEEACFGVELIKAYTELVDAEPNISRRDLHAFCIGFGLGLKNKTNIVQDKSNLAH